MTPPWFRASVARFRASVARFRASVAWFRASVTWFHGVGCFCGLSLIATLTAQTPTPDVHFTPTRHAIADAMLTLARVTADDVVYDLGSGDGRIPIIAAQKYGARGVGIEIDPRLIAIARQHAREGGVEEKVTFVEGDLFTADITRATVVTLYLSASMNARLEAKLKRELRPGARIVSHQFPIGHWTPDERTRVDFSELFFWQIKP